MRADFQKIFWEGKKKVKEKKFFVSRCFVGQPRLEEKPFFPVI